MKKIQIVSVVMAIAVIISACEATKKMSSQDKGVAVGAVGGAVLGGVIGNQAGNTAAGAVIGGVIGGVAGGVIGHRMDKQREEIEKIENAKVEKVNNGEGL